MARATAQAGPVLTGAAPNSNSIEPKSPKHGFQVGSGEWGSPGMEGSAPSSIRASRRWSAPEMSNNVRAGLAGKGRLQGRVV